MTDSAAIANTAPVAMQGQELLDFLKAHPGLKESEAILATGHYKVMPKGGQRMNRTAYYKAIGNANGYVPAAPDRKPRGLSGPKGVLVVGPSGLIPLGAAYSRLLNLQPGDYVSVYEDQGVLVVDPGTDEAKDAKAKAALKPAKAAEPAPSPEAAPPCPPDAKPAKAVKAPKTTLAALAA
jgi:hypothetical protein